MIFERIEMEKFIIYHNVIIIVINLSNVSKNINKDGHSHNEFINLNNLYTLNQLYFKYFPLKPINFIYNKFEGSI